MKIAIILYTYNCENTIKNTIESIKKQTNTDWKLFIVDDYSTDNTILKIPKDDRIFLLKLEEHIGPSESKNKIIKIIDNDFQYIAYCNPGDLWYDFHLNDNLNLLKQHNVDFIFFDYSDNNIFNINDLYNTNIINLSSVIHKKECLSIGFFNSKFDSSEDWDYWLRIAKAGYKIKKNNKQTVFFNKIFIDNKIYDEIKKEHLNTNLKIRVLATCKNEEDILPYFLRYYSSFCNEIIIYDNGSTDKSIETINSFPRTKLFYYNTDNKMNTEVMTKIQNTEYKNNSEIFDWQIIVDIDEIVYHPKLIKKLIEYKQQNITIPLIKGYQMQSLVFPTEEKNIFDIIQTGIRHTAYDKKCIFNPQNVNINYLPGRHKRNPTGNIKYSDNNEIKLLHYCFLSYNYFYKKNSNRNNERSDENKRKYLGTHYEKLIKISEDEFISMYKKCENIL